LDEVNIDVRMQVTGFRRSYYISVIIAGLKPNIQSI